MNPTQVALYARVSSEQQAEAQTIASQVAALRSRITVDGLTVSEAMQFLDEGYSGATWSAPPRALGRGPRHPPPGHQECHGADHR